MSIPTVSAVVPNYNHARYLKQRLDSILHQTRQDIELLYLDDASTDDSNLVAQQFTSDPRVRVILNQRNSGSPFLQWNKGVSEARGKYVWIAEADDYAQPNILERLSAVLDSSPNVGLAYCQSVAVDADAQVLNDGTDWTNDLNSDRWRAPYINRGVDECQKYLSIKNTIPNASAVIFRRNLYAKAAIENTTFRFCGDWYTWVTILLQSDVAFLPDPLNCFRRHSTSASAARGSGLQLVEESYRVVEHIHTSVGIPEKQLNISSERLMDLWMRALTKLRNPNERQLVATIYRRAKHIDPQLYTRVLKKIWRFVPKLIRTVVAQIPLVVRLSAGNRRNGHSRCA